MVSDRVEHAEVARKHSPVTAGASRLAALAALGNFPLMGIGPGFEIQGEPRSMLGMRAATFPKWIIIGKVRTLRTNT